MPATRPIDLSNPLRCQKPWEGKSNSHGPAKSKPMPESLSYKGWTLVNAANGWRYAVRGAERIRVCRAMAEPNAALRVFRAKIDEFEDAR